MALFMGRKPSDNKPLLHVTSGSESVSQMNGAPIASTLFHSDFPYMAIQKMFKITRFVRYRTEKISSGNRVYYHPVFPAELTNLVNQGYLVHIHRAGMRNNGEYYEIPRGESADYPIRAKVVLANGTTGPNNQTIASGYYQNSYPAFQIGSGNSSFLPLPTRTYNTNIGVGVVGNKGKWESMSGLKSKYTSLSGFTREEALWYQEGFTNGGNTSATANYRARRLDDITGTGYNATGGVYEELKFFKTGESIPTYLDHHISGGNSVNWLAKVYVFNVRYGANGQLEHVRPTSGDGIEISREDLNVGNLSIKNGMILTDQNPEIISLNQSSANSDKKNFFKDIFNKFRGTQLFDYPFPFASVTVTSPTKYSIQRDKASLLQTLAPALQVGNPATLEFNQDQIKFTGPRGQVLLADRHLQFTPLKLGSEFATNVRFPTRNVRFSSLVQGAQFHFLGKPAGISWIDPNSGWHSKTEVLSRVPLPPGSTRANSITAHMSPIRTTGQLKVTHEGKYTRLNLGVQPYRGVPLINIHRFERAHPDVEYTVARFGLAVFDDLLLQHRGSSREGYRMFSSTRNRIQSVDVSYKYRVNWTRNEVELVAYYKLAGKNRVNYVDFQDGTHEYFNTIGVNEVLYTIPEVGFDMYILNAG